MTAIAKKPLRQVSSVREMLVNDMAKEQLAMVAAKHMSPDRMMRLMANALRTTPKLGDCDPLSLLGSMMTCASLGLEPNTPLGHAYLIPFGKTVTLVIGYKGMIKLALQSDLVQNIHGDVVYEDDEFSFAYGTEQHLHHVPCGVRENPRWAYCYARLKDGEAFIVLPYQEVLKSRDHSEGYKSAKKYGKSDAPWIDQEHKMASKTAVRAIFAELPVSIEKVSDALAIDDAKVDYKAFAMYPTEGVAMGETIEGQAEEPEAPKTAKPVKATPKAEPEPEPQTTVPDVNEQQRALVDRIIQDVNEAGDLGAVEAVLDLWSDQLETIKGTVAYQDAQDAADARREALAGGA